MIVPATDETKYPRARQLAREAADRYFTWLISEIPSDSSPGDVNLIEAVIDIEAAINEDDRERLAGWEDAAKLTAGVSPGR